VNINHDTIAPPADQVRRVEQVRKPEHRCFLGTLVGDDGK
jgi:hypothetical protein